MQPGKVCSDVKIVSRAQCWRTCPWFSKHMFMISAKLILITTQRDRKNRYYVHFIDRTPRTLGGTCKGVEVTPGYMTLLFDFMYFHKSKNDDCNFW